eukprot:gnl/TRDRNA2_/TRDRNA2_193748_c0_seq1.p1 gnl/TRDRNA2_/TRDRNA2_193748_c0~~gnl/TRDRNA2_/TRDRNA2_193748_c0_seq1.p1  ORF type:complete len:396 (+),score=60.72 gnl/TRDRNA2_/TRDRNA2_193748_c0_seq1:43-1230(+)
MAWVSDGADSDESSSWLKCILRCLLPLLSLVYWFFCLCLLLFQIQAYVGLTEGDQSKRSRVLGAGITGMFLAFAPLPTYLLQDTNPLKMMFFGVDFCWLLWTVAVVVTGSSMGIAFFVIMCLPGEAQASLIATSTVLQIHSDCAGGRLLQIAETLDYKLDKGFTRSVKRTLPNQIEPSNFAAEGLRDVGQVFIEKVDRKEPGKHAMNYESGQLTELTLSFDNQYALNGSNTFTLLLHYDARLRGISAEDECCKVNGDLLQVEGWWENFVPDEVETSFRISGCSGDACNSTAWNVDLDPGRGENGEWLVKFQAPAELEVNSKRCPLAWELTSRNHWWVACAICIAAAAFCCFSVASAGDSGGAGVAILACVACLLVLAFIFMMFALVSDFHTESEK